MRLTSTKMFLLKSTEPATTKLLGLLAAACSREEEAPRVMVEKTGAGPSTLGAAGNQGGSAGNDGCPSPSGHLVVVDGQLDLFHCQLLPRRWSEM